MKITKNQFFLGSLIAVLAVFALVSTKVSATTSLSGSSDSTMNPPALGVMPVGCDLSVATVYSPQTGESCSINGVAITPPIVMMPPYDMYGCKVGSPYSMLTGNKCSGVIITPLPPIYNNDVCAKGAIFSTATGARCSSLNGTGGVKPTPTPTSPPIRIEGCVGANVFSTVSGKSCSDITPLPPIYDCTIAKNAYCGGTSNTPPIVIVSNDIRSIQYALNSALGTDLSVALKVDGQTGVNTRAAIKLFQNKVGLQADGIIGPLTLEKLRASIQ